VLLAFVVFVAIAFAFSALEKMLSKWVWVIVIFLAIAFSLFLGYRSVSNVWVPYQLSDNVFREQSALGNYRGTFPSSQLSYPFSLNVYHTPPNQQTYSESPEPGYGYGEARFTILFLNANTLQINGAFSYVTVMEPWPLGYRMNFEFSDPIDFYVFLVIFYGFVNALGALAGIIVARTLYRKTCTSGQIHPLSLRIRRRVDGADALLSSQSTSRRTLIMIKLRHVGIAFLATALLIAFFTLLVLMPIQQNLSGLQFHHSSYLADQLHLAVSKISLLNSIAVILSILGVTYIVVDYLLVSRRFEGSGLIILVDSLLR
jgi:hypothetical protein